MQAHLQVKQLPKLLGLMQLIPDQSQYVVICHMLLLVGQALHIQYRQLRVDTGYTDLVSAILGYATGGTYKVKRPSQPESPNVSVTTMNMMLLNSSTFKCLNADCAGAKWGAESSP